ncbi:MAG: hypothetical protein K6A80_10415 [Saccharofermentans sp.]|nr:hypothetical protein [Saccharofermentans sp.]
MADTDMNELNLDDLKEVTGGITPIRVDVFGTRTIQAGGKEKKGIDWDKDQHPVKA